MRKYRVLITGGRSPVALDISRNMFNNGCEVFIAESLKMNLSRFSNSVTRSFYVPSPRFKEKEFIQSVLNVINEYKIDLLIPTCEETFYISKYRDEIYEKMPNIKVFVDKFDKIISLHNKFDFIKQTEKLGYNIPMTFLVKDEFDMKKYIEKNLCVEKWVIKPVYSRFGSEVKIFSRDSIPKHIPNFSSKLWIVQEFICGDQLSSYTVCSKGVVNANVVYSQYFNIRNSASMNFINIEDNYCKNFIDNFVYKSDFHGQISFDFIRRKDGKVFLIECNPRTTSGVHFLAHSSNIVKLFLGEERSDKVLERQAYKINLPMLFIGVRYITSVKQLNSWIKVVFCFRDIIFNVKDLKPFLFQFAVFFKLIQIAITKRIKITQASTFDIEWNG